MDQHQWSVLSPTPNNWLLANNAVSQGRPPRLRGVGWQRAGQQRILALVACARAFDVAAISGETAKQVLLQPFSGVGSIRTESSPTTMLASSVNGTRMMSG
jgi:hypothetical protein